MPVDFLNVIRYVLFGRATMLPLAGRVVEVKACARCHAALRRGRHPSLSSYASLFCPSPDAAFKFKFMRVTKPPLAGPRAHHFEQAGHLA